MLRVAADYGCARTDDLLAELGYGKFSPRQVLAKATGQPLVEKPQEEPPKIVTTVKRFLRAYSEGIFEFKTNRDRAVKIYAGRLKQKDLSILEETHSYYAPKFALPPRIERSGIANTLDLVRQTSDVKADANLSGLVDESLIDELEREGFYKKLLDSRVKK